MALKELIQGKREEFASYLSDAFEDCVPQLIELYPDLLESIRERDAVKEEIAQGNKSLKIWKSPIPIWVREFKDKKTGVKGIIVSEGFTNNSSLLFVENGVLQPVVSCFGKEPSSTESLQGLDYLNAAKQFFETIEKFSTAKVTENSIPTSCKKSADFV